MSKQSHISVQQNAQWVISVITLQFHYTVVYWTRQDWMKCKLITLPGRSFFSWACQAVPVPVSSWACKAVPVPVFSWACQAVSVPVLSWACQAVSVPVFSWACQAVSVPVFSWACQAVSVPIFLSLSSGVCTCFPELVKRCLCLFSWACQAASVPVFLSLSSGVCTCFPELVKRCLCLFSAHHTRGAGFGSPRNCHHRLKKITWDWNPFML